MEMIACIPNKLAPYGTDSQLFTTAVSTNLKVTTQKLGQISKNSARTNLDIVP